MIATGHEIKKINVAAICSNAVHNHKITEKDWGFSLMADSELDALRIAYAYRNVPHGVKVEHCPTVGQYMVTVFNDTAKASGIDGAK